MSMFSESATFSESGQFVLHYKTRSGVSKGTLKFFDTLASLYAFVETKRQNSDFAFKVFIRSEEAEADYESNRKARVEKMRQQREEALAKLTPEERTALGV